MTGGRTEVSRDQLERDIRGGEIDTVLMVFPDLQGRLTGKRTTGRFFLESVAEAGTENCDYLIACDMDNNPVPGYRFASYEQGYGDMLARADWDTIRRIPWVDKTAMIMCDLFDVDTGELVEVAPRTILRRQEEAAAALGFLPMVASEIEFYLFHDTYDEAYDKGYRDLRPHSPWLEDYHILQTTKDEYILGQIRRGLEAAGVPVEFSKGEAGRGQHEMNLDYTTAVEMADRNSVYRTAAKEIAHLNGRSISFMAKYDFSDTGSSCHVHSSLWSLDGKKALFDDHHGPHGMSETFRQFIAGLVRHTRELTLLLAPNVNSYKRFVRGSFAPTALVWGHDNRTCALRVVGHGAGMRVESRVAGGDVNPYMAFAALLAAGLAGIDGGYELGPAWEGSGYDAGDQPHVPSTLLEARELFAGSALAREALGDEVVDHYLNAATVELDAFGAAVTDWELKRSFERL